MAGNPANGRLWVEAALLSGHSVFDWKRLKGLGLFEVMELPVDGADVSIMTGEWEWARFGGDSDRS